MKNNKKTIVGVIVSDKMDKTRVVAVKRTYRHKFYQKTIRKTKKYYVHDEKNETHIGDKVKIMEHSPLSKLKRWVIVGKI